MASDNTEILAPAFPFAHSGPRYSTSLLRGSSVRLQKQTINENLSQYWKIHKLNRVNEINA